MKFALIVLIIVTFGLQAGPLRAGDGPKHRSNPTKSSGTLDLRAKGAESQSINIQDTLPTWCDHLLTYGTGYLDEGKWKESYDTLRLFMEGCPFYHGGHWNAGIDSRDVFKYINSAISQWSAGGDGRWAEYLEWLKSVLYLNPDNEWYCNDVNSMMTALQTNEAAQMAVAKYMLESGKCYPEIFEQYYNSASHWRHELWLDSIKFYYGEKGFISHELEDSVNADTLRNPYDSTIPSLHQVGLEILLGPQNAVAGRTGTTNSLALLDADLLDNPVSSDIGLSFEMGRTALVTMQLQDILGHSIPIENAKYQLEQPGIHQAHISAANLSPGTYYLRITTDTGETRTLKVVKQ